MNDSINAFLSFLQAIICIIALIWIPTMEGQPNATGVIAMSLFAPALVLSLIVVVGWFTKKKE